MATADLEELKTYCVDVARRAKAASQMMVSISGEEKNNWLRQSAARLRARADSVLAANELDIEAAPAFGLTEAQTDRLRLSDERIDGIATAMEEIAALPDPIGEVFESVVRPNGMLVNKVRVPLGVVFFVYESRPNVTADAAAICVKSGNAVILRGGKEAANSSYAIVDILNAVAAECGLPVEAVQLVATREREAVSEFLRQREFIDLAIPRGGESLIRRVAADATMPVIKHFSGNCHVYVDKAADLDMAYRIVVNSKCQRMGVCNAAESMLVHAEVASAFLPRIAEAFEKFDVEIRGDARTRELVPTAEEVTEEDYKAEFLAPIISSKIVGSLDEAIKHINQHGSGHTDTIVTDSLSAAHEFVSRVDTAAAMINASTRLNDGGEFGLGAEIGISTDKFHARGPCGLRELTSYKYVVHGNGQIKA